MARESILLDRFRPPVPPPPLAWPTLVDAFEAACLLRCAPAPVDPGRRRCAEPRPTGPAEFNRQEAAHRMWQLLDRLDVPVRHEVAVGGLRRRYELHRLWVPDGHRHRYLTLLAAGWHQGRRELLGGPAPGASNTRRTGRSRLAGAAWRSALLAGGRHVRRHILGVRLADRDLAAVLIRSAALLDVPALLRPGAGCFVVSVADGPDRDRILAHTTLPAGSLDPTGRPTGPAHPAGRPTG
ncbi:hypothetical protein [Micromonospora yangpuensis]|uniref:Uncharacterized protein n=1 Tax=Micromonospora yangpuensis TaxID=683228 RepID=A0A1C6UGY0_9ACTN|nr:hypothetical protein [Micromonospora yangpuensis]GGM04913.1 hypothetical protein GCM10012279_23280 [Micromonospora yangpuensis]SCL53113.1 hypothetical protein GA0070617_2269 [Micromonospora yangpuensis]